MAQWQWQFSGLTHESKVADAEDTLRTAVAALRTAVAALRTAAPDAIPAKAGAVRRLAARLLTARLKLLTARRAAATPVNAPSPRYDRLVEQEAAMRAAGVEAILVEFGAADVRDTP